jgi:hypothetical protein
VEDKLKDFRARVRKFIPIAKDAKEKNLNEADTRMRIRVLLSDVLGYDMLEEITQEHMVQGHYVDLTVKAPMWDKAANKYKPGIIFFIEAKSVETTLRDTHVYQAVNYAASGGVNLCVLTNGIDYRLYHLTWDKAKVESSQILSFSLLDEQIDDLAEKLHLLSKESFRKGIMEKYIIERTSLHDNNLAQALFSPRVLGAIRLELKAMTGHNAKEEAIEHSLSKLVDGKLYEMVKACGAKPVKKPKKPSTAEESAVPGPNVFSMNGKGKN